jgi:hypothetical protein
MVGSIVALFHPAVDVVAVLDFPILVRQVAEGLQLRGDPECAPSIAACITDDAPRHIGLPRNAVSPQGRPVARTIHRPSPVPCRHPSGKIAPMKAFCRQLSV